VFPHFAKGATDVIYKDIQYTIAATDEPDIWRWQFQIGDAVRSGRTQTRLAKLAARRVESKIDAALRALASSAAQESGN
jgi:uncharacterized membrane protein YcjF (UPF0283 family)